MEMRDTCVLTFATSLGNNKVIRLHDPNPNITALAVDEAVSPIIDDVDMFDSSVGKLINLMSAVMVTETTRTILPAA